MSLQKDYRPGQAITIKTGILHDADLELYVNGVFISKQTAVKTDGTYTHWEFYFTMPEQDVVILLQTSGKTEPPTISPTLEDYAHAEALAAEGKLAEAAIAFARLGDFQDAKEQCLALWDEVRDDRTILVYGGYLIAIRSDGTVITNHDGNAPAPNVENWTMLCSLAAGQDHIVGLKSDGTVVATGDNSSGQCNVEDWTDIVSIDCGANFTVGLKADGTVVLAGDTKNGIFQALQWSNMVQIEAAGEHLIGLRCNGTAFALGSKDEDLWIAPLGDDIIDIYLDTERSIYLRSDGTIHILGNKLYVRNQKIPGLLTVESNGHYLAGKMLDDILYFNGYSGNISASTADIVAIIDYGLKLIGLRRDGVLVHLLTYGDSSTQIPNWSDLMTP